MANPFNKLAQKGCNLAMPKNSLPLISFRIIILFLQMIFLSRESEHVVAMVIMMNSFDKSEPNVIDIKIITILLK